MLVLGIETSCDETAASIVGDGRTIYSNVIASQVNIHRRFGGIVPEVASRSHVESIGPVVLQALEEAGVSLNDVSGIAVTNGPGLIGSLLVGLSFAKALAFATSLPFVGINHVAGHIAAILLSEDSPQLPFIALVVSGGHTSLFNVIDYNVMNLLGQTKDDAAGEAFDKAAKMLGIGYPGGFLIDNLAKEGNKEAYLFPRAMKNSLDFSFSGLKTSLLQLLKKKGNTVLQEELPDIAASYQEAIVDVLTTKTIAAAELCSVKDIVVCGGVASNSRLRSRFVSLTGERGMNVFIPPPVLCTDNAAMIAALGYHLLKDGKCDPLSLDAMSRFNFAA